MVKLLSISSSISSSKDKVHVRYETTYGFYELEYEPCVSLPSDFTIFSILKDIEFPNYEYLKKVMDEIYNKNVVLLEDSCSDNSVGFIKDALRQDNILRKRILVSVQYSKSTSCDIITLSLCNIFGKDYYDLAIKFDAFYLDSPLFDYADQNGRSIINKPFDSEELAVDYILGYTGLKMIASNNIEKTILAEPIKFVELRSIALVYEIDKTLTLNVAIELNGSKSLIVARNLAKLQNIDDLYDDIASTKVKTISDFLEEVKDALNVHDDSITVEDV